MSILPSNDVHSNHLPVLSILKNTVICIIILNEIFIFQLTILKETARRLIVDKTVLSTQNHHKWSLNFISHVLVKMF
jgi:hypothetical protein